jgi:hypothetical protein
LYGRGPTIPQTDVYGNGGNGGNVGDDGNGGSRRSTYGRLPPPSRVITARPLTSVRPGVPYPPQSPRSIRESLRKQISESTSPTDVGERVVPPLQIMQPTRYSNGSKFGETVRRAIPPPGVIQPTRYSNAAKFGEVERGSVSPRSFTGGPGRPAGSKGFVESRSTSPESWDHSPVLSASYAPTRMSFAPLPSKIVNMRAKNPPLPQKGSMLRQKALHIGEMVLPEVKGGRAEYIGAGVFGVTFNVHNERNGKSVLVKAIYKGDGKRDGTNYKDFRREVEILQSLKSVCDDYIVCYKDVYYDDDDYYFIATEYLGKYKPLSKAISSGLSDDKIITIFSNLLKGINLIHERGIVHRDIKPDNIMVNDDGDIKYIDFGLAYKLNGLGDAIQDVHLAGTLVYINPQLFKQRARFTSDDLIKNDWYGIGITVVEMMTGHHPYANKLRSGSVEDVYRAASTWRFQPTAESRRISVAVDEEVYQSSRTDLIDILVRH